jgi:hypothetical protein
MDLAPQTGGGCVFQGQYRVSSTIVIAAVNAGTLKVNVGKWHFIAFRRSGTSVNAFINKTKSTTANDASVLNVTFNTDWYIGDDLNTGVVTFMRYYLDDLCFVNYALTDIELRQIYSEGQGRNPYIFIPNTCPLYRANEPKGSSQGVALLMDSSVHGLHGTMTGYTTTQQDFVNHYTLK